MATSFIELGGVDFLSQLRPHLDSTLHSTLDEIIENLLKVPSSYLKNIASSDSSATAKSFTSQSTSDMGPLSRVPQGEGACTPDITCSTDEAPSSQATRKKLARKRKRKRRSRKSHGSKDGIDSHVTDGKTCHVTDEACHVTIANECDDALFAYLQLSNIDHQILDTTLRLDCLLKYIIIIVVSFQTSSI